MSDDRIKNLIEFYLDPVYEDEESAEIYLEEMGVDTAAYEKEVEDFLAEQKWSMLQQKGLERQERIGTKLGENFFAEIKDPEQPIFKMAARDGKEIEDSKQKEDMELLARIKKIEEENDTSKS